MSATTPEAAWDEWTPAQVKKRSVRVYRLADGTYEGISATGEVPEGAELLDPQPKRRGKGDPHLGTAEGLKQLEETYPDLIAWGCYFAVAIARENLTVHSREVRAKMADRGLINDHSGPEHWMGAVFKRLKKEGVLVETPHRYKYSSELRGIHEREVKIWALNQGTDLSKYLEAPASTAPKKKGKVK